MSDFDDRLRDSHRRILPIAATEAGWQGVRQRIQLPPARIPPAGRFGAGFGWGAVTATALCLLLHQLFFAAPETPPRPERPVVEAASETSAPANGIPLADRQSAVVVGTEPARTETATRTTAAPAGSGNRSEYSITSGSPISNEPGEGTIGPASTAAAKFSAPATPPANRPVAQLSATIAGTSLSPVSLRQRPLILPLPAAAPVFTNAVDPQQPKWTFQRIERAQQPAARWEVGASAIAFAQRETYFARPLLRQPFAPGQAGTPVRIDGREDTLYTAPRFDSENYTNPFGFRMGYVEVAHQFPNGIRLSGGLIAQSDGNAGNRRPEEVFNRLTDGNDYTLVEVNAYRALYTALTFQYTIFRRRRFRLSPGFSLLGHWLSTRTTTDYVVEGQGLPTGSQTSLSHKRQLWSEVDLVPSLQAQYQIGRHVSLTADLLPGIGVGARYRFDQ